MFWGGPGRVVEADVNFKLQGSDDEQDQPYNVITSDPALGVVMVPVVTASFVVAVMIS